MDAIGAQRRSARDAFDEAVWSRHPDAGVNPWGSRPRPELTLLAMARAGCLTVESESEGRKSGHEV
jgi:hypothetical protein